MKVTETLLAWLRDEKSQKNWSYADMETLTGTPWQTYQRLWRGMSKEINEDTAEALCKLLDLTKIELYVIADPNLMRHEGTYTEPNIQDAMRLLRWVNDDKQRAGGKGKIGREMADLKEVIADQGLVVERLTNMFADGLIDAANSGTINARLSAAVSSVNEAKGRLDALASIADNESDSVLVQRLRAFSSMGDLVAAYDRNPEAMRGLFAQTIAEVRWDGEQWGLLLNIPGSSKGKNWLRELVVKEPLKIGVFAGVLVSLVAA